MKRIYKLALLILLLFPLRVCAAGGFSLSSSSISMYPGETKTITITSDNSVGKLNISSSNSGVASVSTGSIFIKYPGSSESINITANSVGTTTISVVASENYATMEEERLTGQTKTVTVNVIEKPTEPAPQQPSNPTPSYSNSNQNYYQNNLSSNNALKDISIDNYKLEKIDNNNYSLTVPNNVTNINLNATSEDSKASVSGTGNKEIKVGENVFEITVTAENGSRNTIYVKVNRKDGYYLEDLETVLKDKNIKEIDIIINDETKISESDLNKIKKSKKVVNFNYYDKDKKLLYIWSINGKEIKESEEFDTFLAFTTEHLKEINKLSNYADGIYVKFQHSGSLPTGTSLKIYVGEKYKNKDEVNLYRYNKNAKKLELLNKGLLVKDEYIEFDIDYCSDLFITMSNISNSESNDKSSSNLLLTLLIIAIVIIISLLIFIFIKIKPNKKKTSMLDIKDNSKVEVLDDNVIL